jgi:trehalose 6-phosphate synthase/phosphatase
MKIDLVKKYKIARSRLLLFDYDGTLVSIRSSPDEAMPSAYLFDLLDRLCHAASTKVVIITGRKYRDIDLLIGRLPLDIIAEHGAMIKEGGTWHRKADHDVEWKKSIAPLMNKMSSECTGTFLEEKDFSLTWHYRNTDPLGGFVFSRELIKIIRDTAEANGLRILDGNQVIEVMSDSINKGYAALQMVEKGEYDYVLAIGDDKTDEDMFAILSDKENCYTIKVGYGKTLARHKLDNVADVIRLIKSLICD